MSLTFFSLFQKEFELWNLSQTKIFFSRWCHGLYNRLSFPIQKHETRSIVRTLANFKTKWAKLLSREQQCSYSSFLVFSLPFQEANGTEKMVSSPFPETSWSAVQIRTNPLVPGPSTPPGFGLREAIKTRQSRSYETATFADLIGRSMGGVSPQIFWCESSIFPSFRYKFWSSIFRDHVHRWYDINTTFSFVFRSWVQYLQEY